MQDSAPTRQYTIHGLTFTLFKGGKRRKQLRTAIPDLYPNLIDALAEKARKDPEDVRDSLHDLLAQELGKKRRGIQDLESYLKVAAFNRYQRSFRNEGRLVPLSTLLDEEALEIQDEHPNCDLPAGEQAAVREMGRRTWAQLERLPLRQRYVLTMWCFGLSNAQIAQELELTEENVRFHKHVAIQSIRSRLGVKIEETA
jgi:DNA-directed RNA polymerase specialized sigma24 family protein